MYLHVHVDPSMRAHGWLPAAWLDARSLAVSACRRGGAMITARTQHLSELEWTTSD